VNYYLDALTAGDCEAARTWRNQESVRLGLRTPHILTAEMQRAFYDDVVCNRSVPHRFWAVRSPAVEMPPEPLPPQFNAMVGLSPISWEAGSAEISLVVDPNKQGQGVGAAAIELLLTEAFDRMRLVTVHGEVFLNNPATEFWQKQIKRWRGESTLLPRRKWWDGRLVDALYFWFQVDRWRDVRAEHVALALVAS